jgi:hypothetical protein
MQKNNFNSSKSALENVRQQFDTWRKNKTCKHTPQKLWHAAINLHCVEGLSIHRISKELHLNYNDFKKQITDNNILVIKEVETSDFIELKYSQEVPSECLIEMENIAGSKMRMSFKGKTDFDLMELGKSFWRQS